MWDEESELSPPGNCSNYLWPGNLLIGWLVQLFSHPQQKFGCSYEKLEAHFSSHGISLCTDRWGAGGSFQLLGSNSTRICGGEKNIYNPPSNSKVVVVVVVNGNPSSWLFNTEWKINKKQFSLFKWEGKGPSGSNSRPLRRKLEILFKWLLIGQSQFFNRGEIRKADFL